VLRRLRPQMWSDRFLIMGRGEGLGEWGVDENAAVEWAGRGRVFDRSMCMLHAVWAYRRYHGVLRRWRLRGWLAKMPREERYRVGGVEALRELGRFSRLGGDTGHGNRERARLRDIAVEW
jgi:hypothetical protein